VSILAFNEWFGRHRRLIEAVDTGGLGVFEQVDRVDGADNDARVMIRVRPTSAGCQVVS